MFKAAQFMIAKTWGQGDKICIKCEWGEKFVFIYTAKYSSVIKRYRLLTHYMGAEKS